MRSQIARVRAELETRPEGLVRHAERVLVEALDLGRVYDLDPQRLELAVWGHDLFRAATDDDLLSGSQRSGVNITPEDEASPVLLHGPLAAAVLASTFGVEDDEVLAAVRDHTLGLAHMSTLAKVILLADKVESNKRRGDAELQAIRGAAQKNLDLALLCWSDRKWFIERIEGWHSDSRHWTARTAWVAGHHRSDRSG